MDELTLSVMVVRGAVLELEGCVPASEWHVSWRSVRELEGGAMGGGKALDEAVGRC